ncbi:MAG: hypothetical protein FWD46_09650 [Cystobacterineae bacterium]|nr:hypothetical protein [Cystobacterineae bacterium]
MKAAYRLVLCLGLCAWAWGAWAQVGLDGGNQHNNDQGRGYIDLNIQLGLIHGNFLRFECSMQRNPFPNSGSVPLQCEGQPVVRPAPVWGPCDERPCNNKRPCSELLASNIVNRYIWRVHSPIEDRYTFQVRAVSDAETLYSETATMFLDMRSNPIQIEGPRDRRVSHCTNVRVLVHAESQPRVWYTTNGEYPSLMGEGSHAVGSPCFPHKVEFQVPFLQKSFHDPDGREDQPGWNVPLGQTLLEKIRIQDIWGGQNNGHPAPPDASFSLHCDPSTPPNVRFLTPTPPNSPLPAAIFEFDSDIVDATFECALNNAPFAACSSPHRVDGFVQGRQHTLAIRAVNAVGIRGLPQSQTWARTATAGGLAGLRMDNPRGIGIQHSSLSAADGAAPTNTQLLVLVTAPARLGGGLVAQCRLVADDLGRWRCPISKVLYDANAYVVEVYAWNGNNYGFIEETFSIDEALPMGTIDGDQRPRLLSANGENSAGGRNLAFAVEWNYVGLPANVGDASDLECRLDGEAYEPCCVGAVGQTTCVYKIPQTGAGLHRFQMRIAASGIPSDPRQQPQTATPLEYVWFQTAGHNTPELRPEISFPPKVENGEQSWLGGTSLVLRGKATEPRFFPLSIYFDNATTPVCERVFMSTEGAWECEIENAAEGEHEVTARIDILPKDSAGNYWASRKFGFLPGLPKTFLTRRPSKHEQDSGATFEFASPRKQVHFKCIGDGIAVDNNGGGFCKSPVKFSNLSQGAHTFSVYAVDFAGQTELAPVTWTWTVGNVPPPSGCNAMALAPAWALGLLALGLWARRKRE